MRCEDVSVWLERYVAAWKSGERGAIEALFSEDARYRYHSYDEPVVGRAAIADSWLDDPDEPGSFDASYACFAADGDAAVAIGTSTYFDPDGEVARVYDDVLSFASTPRDAARTSRSGTSSARKPLRVANRARRVPLCLGPRFPECPRAVG